MSISLISERGLISIYLAFVESAVMQAIERLEFEDGSSIVKNVLYSWNSAYLVGNDTNIRPRYEAKSLNMEYPLPFNQEGVQLDTQKNKLYGIFVIF